MTAAELDAVLAAIAAADGGEEVSPDRASKILGILGVQIGADALERLRAEKPDEIAFRRDATGGALYSIGTLRAYAAETIRLRSQ